MLKKILNWLNQWLSSFQPPNQERTPTPTFSVHPKEDQQHSLEALPHLYANYDDYDNKGTPELNHILDNLKILQSTLSTGKETAPELRFSQIKQYLGVGEQYETIRQDRWYPTIHCPSCQATQIKRTTSPSNSDQSHHNYRYICQVCGFEFNDDTGTPFERGTPPLSVWMHCWYLLGCTNSYTYIAQKLGLELTMVEYMVEQLEKTFNAEQPLTHFIDQRDRLKHNTHLQQKFNIEERQKKEELLTSTDVSNVPKDTAEYRKQKDKRQNPTNHPKKII